MNLKVENSFGEIADRARDRYEDAVQAARKGTEKAASRVTRGKKPVRTISKYGVKISGVSHRTVNKLWRRQTKLVEHQFDALAEHLKAAADAENLKNFIEKQIELIPDDTDRFADEARETLQIVKVAGSEIRDIVKGAVDELVGKKAAAAKTPAQSKTSAKAAKPARASAATASEVRAA
jgi:phasin family protein